MSIDWSMHDGYSYVTSPRNQFFTNFCWGFAVTALIESMVRREHGAWCARSEGDLFFGLRYFTFLGGDPNAASDFVYENGLADPDCVPWFGTEANFAHPESGSADRAGRVVRAPRIQEVNGINTQIHWLHIIGPLIGSFDVFDDFGAFYFYGTGVYQPAATAINTRGNHFVMIFGVDE